jgi:pimeloyl-ACP methyl ester carboxylesterase
MHQADHLCTILPWPGGGDALIPWPLPLPGIVIFVHGVNSDGEWYEEAERGLCAGLNERLRRRDQDMRYTGPDGGQLAPVRYGAELTGDGFISPLVNPNSFIDDSGSRSPVIRFRWGYKASADELQRYGAGIYLNENNYWGGGPFANGCSTLPDLWGSGLSEELFLWWQVQHMNPEPGRQIFDCPPRAYFVLAAYRLARLVESIRQKQADVPITIVCHSQGNMVGMAAAFLGERFPPATDGNGRAGACVADNYVLCNPPYSLKPDNLIENWSLRGMRDRQGRTGRQTLAARDATLAAFLNIIRERSALATVQTAARIDKECANEQAGFTTTSDRQCHGYPADTSSYGRVTLYCNPHDQVISATPVHGIGWCGLSDQRLDGRASDIERIGAAGVLVQRVFAQGVVVGRQGRYHYWDHHWRHPGRGSSTYWHPPSKPARFALGRAMEASGSWLGKAATLASAPVPLILTSLVTSRINAIPPEDWSIPLQAPDLPEPFLPQSKRYGNSSERFDEGYDPPGRQRNRQRQLPAGDAYTGVHATPDGGTDQALGGEADEAALRYEHHAMLRMKARRYGMVKPGEQVVQEDQPDTASADYTTWRGKQIEGALREGVEANASDHSTILTNDMHARKALAYDVAVGICTISQRDLLLLRKAADWRLLKKIELPTHLIFHEYFQTGEFCQSTTANWATSADGEAHMPKKIVDVRENPRNNYRGHP